MDQKTVAKVARLLLSSYSKQTAGTPMKWKDASIETRKLWLRLARVAVAECSEPAEAAAAAVD